MSIIEQAKAIGHVHASQDEMERSQHAWGGNFSSTLSSAWNIVNLFVQRVADWFAEQGDDVTEDDIEAEVDDLAERVAGYEVASAIEQEVLDELAAQGVGKMKVVNQPGACAACVARASAGPVPASEFVPPPYHDYCQCNGAPADEEE